jgi:poly(3-hydroxybutyrate) depolymerase
MVWQEIEREYLIFLPSKYQESKELPMVVGLHGYTGTATGFEKETTKRRYLQRNEGQKYL